MDDEQPAVHLSVYWPDKPGMPNSLDIEWAQDNPGSLLNVVQALTGQTLPLLTERASTVTVEWDAKAKVKAVVPDGPCARSSCNHGHDRHGRSGPPIPNIDDPNGGACVVCADRRLCASYVPPGVMIAVGPIAAGQLLKEGPDGTTLVPTQNAEDVVGVAIDSFSPGDRMHRVFRPARPVGVGWAKNQEMGKA